MSCIRVEAVAAVTGHHCGHVAGSGVPGWPAACHARQGTCTTHHSTSGHAPQVLYRDPHHPGLKGMVAQPTHRVHRLRNVRRVLRQMELHPCMPLEQLWRVGDIVDGVSGAAQDLLEDVQRALQRRAGRVRLAPCTCVL